MIEHLPDGIYTDLSFEDYLADPAMSSSDICNLCIDGPTYWAKSPLNPDRLPFGTKALDFGALVHKILLEEVGRPIMVKPKDLNFKTLAGIEWHNEALAKNARIFDLAKKDDAALSMILKAWEHSGVAERMKGGLPEVSFFWTEKSGHRCKIRLDWLLPEMAVDLKTYDNSMGKDLTTVIAHAVANYRYSIKAYWYHLGLEKLRAVIASKRMDVIFGDKTKTYKLVPDWSDTDLKKSFPLYYIFLEKGAPNITPKMFGPRDPLTGDANEYWGAAKNMVNDATREYATYMEEFGPDKPWIKQAKWDVFTDRDFGAAKWIYER